MKYEEYLPKIVDREKYEEYCQFLSERFMLKGTLPNLEGHHIVPKCFLPKEFVSDKENIVYLTCIDHLLAHKLLYEFTKDKRMLYAVYQMTNTYKSKVDENLFENISFEQICEEARKMSSKHQKEKTLTEEHRKHLSEAHKGYIMPIEQRENISRANKGRIKGVEWRKSLSNSHIGRINRKYGTRFIHKEGAELQVWEDELDKYLSEGWQLGRKQLKYTPPSVKSYMWVNKDRKNTRVSCEKLSEYTKEGWKRGRYKKFAEEKEYEKEIHEKKKNAARYNVTKPYHKDFI